MQLAMYLYLQTVMGMHQPHFPCTSEYCSPPTLSNCKRLDSGTVPNLDTSIHHMTFYLMNFSLKLIWQDDVCKIKIQFLVSDVKRRHLKQKEWICPEKQNSSTSFSIYIYIYISLISLVIATSVLK